MKGQITSILVFQSHLKQYAPSRFLQPVPRLLPQFSCPRVSANMGARHLPDTLPAQLSKHPLLNHFCFAYLNCSRVSLLLIRVMLAAPVDGIFHANIEHTLPRTPTLRRARCAALKVNILQSCILVQR